MQTKNKRFTMNISSQQFRELKIIAAAQCTTMTELVTQKIKEIIENSDIKKHKA